MPFQKNSGVRRGPRPMKERSCDHCGEPFRKRSETTDTKRTRFCSRVCYFEFNAAPAPRSRLALKECICGKVRLTRLQGTKFCSERCRAADARRLSKAWYGALPKPVHAPRTCARCFARFLPGHGAQIRFCSKACSKAYERSVSGRTYRQRAKHHGVAWEPIGPFSVFNRDGWKCQICGVKTPRKLRGSIHPRAPELDHRVPMVRGGPHLRTNLQCACRACNGAKGGVRTVGQIPLWA
jgi:hypothetical protein